MSSCLSMLYMFCFTWTGVFLEIDNISDLFPFLYISSTFQNQWVKTLTASVQRLFASSIVTSTAVTTYKYKEDLEKSAANSPGPHTLCSPWPRSCTRPCSSAARSGCQRRRPSPATKWSSSTRLSRPVNMKTLDFDLYFLKKEATLSVFYIIEH